MILQNEFLLYDPLIVDLRNRYLIEASQILTEAMPYQKNQPNADSSWYIKWKGEYSVTLKNAFSKFKEYANRQNQKYNQWLKNNRDYFDARKYNPGSGCSISSAPDYKNAINRIRNPIPTIVNGNTLDRISVPDGNSSNNSPDNQWFYKMIIPEYTGTGDDFLRYAKMYYNGQDSKRTINTKVMATFIPMMLNYCINYMNFVQQLEGQLNTIISFVSRDPVSNIQNPSDSAEKQLQNQEQQKANSNYASTNPKNNIVNASVDYHLFREAYMVLNELGINVPTTKNTIQTKNTILANNVKNRNNKIPNKSSNQQNNPNLLLTNQINKNKINQKQLVMKKKQTAANIIKDAFLAKITAANIIYRDFITTLQVWINGVQEQIKKSNERNARKQQKQQKK